MNAEVTIEVMLYWFIVVIVGVGGVVGFVENALLADLTPQSVSLTSGIQPQRDLAFAYLGFGIMGIMARRLRGSFWLATITGYSVFSIGSACSCIFGEAVKEDMVSGTIQPEVYANLLMPFAMIILWTALWLIRLKDKTTRNEIV